MKKHSFTTVLVFFTIVFSFGQAKEERLVLDLCKQKFLWMIHDRVDSLEAVLDDRLKFIHSTGWIQTKQDLLADVKSGKLNYQTIDVSDMEVRVYGTAAIATGKGTFTGTNTGEPFVVKLLFTEVYILKNKIWQLVSRHANKMP
jgi:hypothetical protein